MKSISSRVYPSKIHIKTNEIFIFSVPVGIVENTVVIMSYSNKKVFQ